MRLLCDGIQSRNPKESELLERSEDEHVLLCIWYILIHLPFLFDIHSACESLLMMPISFENIISEPHDMAGVGLEPDVYPMDELTPEKLITEKKRLETQVLILPQTRVFFPWDWIQVTDGLKHDVRSLQHVFLSH